MYKILNKLKKKNGESLAEVMIAVLISAAGMIILSSLIYVSTNIVSQGNTGMGKLYHGTEVVEEKLLPTLTGKSMIIKLKDATGTDQTVQINTINIYKDTDSGLASYEKG